VIGNIIKWLIAGLLTDYGLASSVYLMNRVEEWRFARDAYNKLTAEAYDINGNKLMAVEITCYVQECIDTITYIEKTHKT